MHERAMTPRDLPEMAVAGEDGQELLVRGVLLYDDSCQHGRLRRFVGRFIPRFHRHYAAWFGMDTAKDKDASVTVRWNAHGRFTIEDDEL